MLAGAGPAAEHEPGRPVSTPTPTQVVARPSGVPSVETLRALFPDLDILDLLGAGGMGAVYKARQPRLNRLVALKIMVGAPGHEVDFALRFEREAQVLARLNHPHIVIIYDFGDLSPERTGGDPLFWFLMEYVDGTDLGQLIKSGELKSAQALAIVPQICEALQYAHDQGITHRDIKPANILIDKRGTVKIADFGLAKMVGGGAQDAFMTGLTQTGTSMGTPHYMAPEQWEHPEQVDHRADIYALGVVFYEMLTGERPAGVFQPPSKKTKPPVDKKLDGVVMRAMEKDPGRRYQQAGQIGDDVTRISGANKRKPAATGAPETKRGTLKPLLSLGTAAALGIGGWMVWPEGDGKVTSSSTLQVASSVKPGRLRAAGVDIKGQPHDLSRFAAYSDFVDVTGGRDRWVALRANGDTVSHDGKSDLKGIRRIVKAVSIMNDYAFITMAGKLIFREGSSNLVPAALEKAMVVDAVLGSDHGLALTDAGVVVTFGLRYQETRGDPADSQRWGTPRWPQPPLHALEKVKAVGSTTTHAATLHHDGTVSVWGWEGLVKWTADPRQKPIQQIASSEDSLWMLDEASQVWMIALPRNPSPQQPIGSLGKARLMESHRAIRLGSRCWLRATGEWCVEEATFNWIFGQNPLAPDAIFSLTTSGFPEKGQAALLWIEPVVPDRAAGPPAPAVPTPAALGGPSAPPQPSALPAHEWVKVDWPGQTIRPAGKPSRKVTQEETAKDGGLRLVKNDLWIGDQVPRIGKVQNGGMRLRWKRLSEKAAAGSFNVFMRGGGKVKVGLMGNGPTIFHGGDTDEFKLQGMSHGGLAPVGQEMLMEISCVGRLLIVKRDGVLQSTLELPEAAPADTLRFQGSEVVVTQAELINLDHLSEADALRVLGVDSAVPTVMAATGKAAGPPAVALPPPTALGGSSALPARPWVKVDWVGQNTYPADKPMRTVTAEEVARDRGLKLGKDDFWLSQQVPGISRIQNGGIRVRWKRLSEAAGNFNIALRGSNRPAVHLIGNRDLVTVYYGGFEWSDRLKDMSHGGRPPVGQEMQVEVACVGRLLILKQDGKLLGTQELPEVAPADFLRLTGTDILITQAELINLDGLSEADALKVLGVDSAAPTIGAAPPLTALGGPSALPGHQWVKVDFASIDPAKTDRRVEHRAGKLHLRDGGRWMPLPSRSFRQVAHRISATWPGEVEWLTLNFVIPTPSANPPEYYAKLSTFHPVGPYWDIGRYQGSSLSFTGNRRIEPSLKIGDAAVFQFATVGGTLYAWLNGRLLEAVRQPDPTLADGCELLVTAKNLALDRYEYLPLDGLSEADALKVLGVDSAVPTMVAARGKAAGPPAAVPPKTALGGPSALPAHEWVKVDWPGQTIYPTGKPPRQVTQEEIMKDGGLRLVKDDLWIGRQVPRIGKVQNGGIRLSWKRLAEKGSFNITLRGDRKANVVLWGDRATIYHGGPSSGFKQSMPHGGPAPTGQEMLMEIACVGRLLILKRDGVLQSTLELPEAAPADYPRFQGGEVVVTQAELINLDGLSEADALKVLGVDSAVPTIGAAKGRAAGPPAAAVPPSTALAGASALPMKPGRLRAAGTLADGKPHDLAKFAAYTDFVEVAVDRSVWLGLRSNGEVISSDGTWDRKDVRRLAGTFGHNFGFIFKDGHAEAFRGPETKRLEPAKDDPITDLVIGNQHGLMLGTSGTARVFGERYETACGNANDPKGYGTPKWPPPPADALNKVKRIAVTTTHAATLHLDGTLSVWNWSGPVKLPQAADLAAITDLASSEDALWLLDARQQVWLLNLPRNPRADQPVTPVLEFLRTGGEPTGAQYARTPGLASAVGNKRWLSLEGAWRSEVKKLDDLLKTHQIGTATSFHNMNGIHDGKLFVSLLWIEPVAAAGGAADLPAAEAGKTALGGPSALPSAAQPRLTGRLRGSGFHIDGSPLDLKNAEGITDFVQVILTDRGWVGLRANGEQVTSEGRWGERDIARLLPGFFNSYGTINRKGHLSIRMEATEGVKAIPEEVQRIGVVDARWNDGCAIALLKDGTVRVWGEVYQEAYRDMPIWPMPPAEALRDVIDIAAPRAMSATLTADGRLHSWGGDKEVGHFVVRPATVDAKFEEIETSWKWVWVRDAAGLTYRLPQRQRTLGAAIARDILDIGSITALPRQATAWTWSDDDRVNAQAEVDALLKQIGNRPRDAFDLRTVGENSASKVAAVWIEPVAAGSAASPSPPLPVSPSSPTPPPFTDREAAEWVLGLGHSACYVKIKPANGPEVKVAALAELPEGPFVITEWYGSLSHKDSPELWEKLTDAVVLRLAGLISLKLAEIRGNVTGASLKLMAHHPGLESLLFEGQNLKADDLRHLRASRLQYLRIPLLRVADPDSLAVLATMPDLRQLQFTECLDSALVAALPKLPKLEILRANVSVNLTDDELPLLVERLPQLTQLQLWSAKKIKGTTLGSLKTLKSLTNLGLTDTSVNDEALAQIAGMPQLLTLGLGQTRITDACLPTLKSFPKLESLQIFQTELTDAALLELTSIRSLKKLGVKTSGYSDWKPKVTFTDAGIAAFQKLRPDVQVVK